MASIAKEITQVTAGDLMTPHVFPVRVDMTVGELADFLAEKEISGAPVVDADGRIVGVVSVTDVAEKSRPESDYVAARTDPKYDVRSFDDQIDYDEIRGLHIENESLLVRDIMTPAVYTVAAEARAPEVARSMVSGHVHRLFVTRAGRIVGVVTAMDLLPLVAGLP